MKNTLKWMVVPYNSSCLEKPSPIFDSKLSDDDKVKIYNQDITKKVTLLQPKQEQPIQETKVETTQPTVQPIAKRPYKKGKRKLNINNLNKSIAAKKPMNTSFISRNATTKKKKNQDLSVMEIDPEEEEIARKPKPNYLKHAANFVTKKEDPSGNITWEPFSNGQARQTS